MNRETLDETIDRVAGEMSAVAGNPALTAQVRERMDARRRTRLKPLLAAASVAAAVVIATVVWPRIDWIEPPAPASRELAANAVAPIVPLVEGGRSVPANAAVRDAEIEASTPPNAALGDATGGTSVPSNTPSAVAFASANADTIGPAPLGIAELTITPMEVPDVPEIAPLQIESLEIVEIAVDQSKEPR